jgi:hypothetical protein
MMSVEPRHAGKSSTVMTVNGQQMISSQYEKLVDQYPK